MQSQMGQECWLQSLFAALWRDLVEYTGAGFSLAGR